MGQPFEPLEGVVDEDPVLVGRSVGVDAVVVLGMATRRRCTAAASGKLEVNVRELVEVGGVVDRLDMHWDGGGPLPDVVPVHPFEEAEGLDVVKTFDSSLRIRAKSAKKKKLEFDFKLRLNLFPKQGVALFFL